MTSSDQNDALIYRRARAFLDELNYPGLTPTIIESYCVAPAADRPGDIPGLYLRLLMSAQTANMKAGVIGGSIGGVNALGPILFNFEPEIVLKHYRTDSRRLLGDIVTRLKPAGKIRRTPRSIWPKYCQTILSSAKFLVQFKSAGDFYAWVDSFDKDNRARPGLPLLISEELEGFGFALACDFLKELGYANFGKPDVHLRDLFKAAGLCEAGAGDFELFKTICRVAENAGVSPYAVDKVFWLIGSGYFYNHPQIGRAGRIPRPKKHFFQLLKSQPMAG